MSDTRTLSVALDVGSLIGPPTGIGRFTADLSRHLRDRPDVAVIPYVLSYRADLPPGARRLKYPARLALAAWAKTDWPTARRSLHGADLVHGTNYIVPPSGLPTLVSVHDLTLFQRPELVLPVVRTFGDVIRRAVDRGAFVHTISHAVANHVRTLLHTDRVRVVYPGPTYDPDQVVGPLPEQLRKGKYILSIGTREPRKNLPRLIEAFGLMHRSNEDCLLVLAGAPGADDESIRRATRSIDPYTAKNIVTLGYVDDATRAALFTNATVFAYPSLDEGFGLPLLEAMHYGVPIVGSTAGAIPEVAADAALLVDPTNVEALAMALQDAYDNHVRRPRLIAAGRQRRGLFSWARATEEMVALYREVVEHG
jgi:glycosyltransferase involved in cell wall biosynthesis